MRDYRMIFSIVLLNIFLYACNTKNPKANHNDSSAIETAYFGQKPPGLIPEIFDNSFLSEKNWELKGVAQDMKEVYLSSSNDLPFFRSVIVFNQDEKQYNVWNKYNFYPASDGNDSILYCKNKYIERTDTGWSEIKSLGSMFEREDWGIMSLSVSGKGTYVFDDYKNNDVIRISTIKDGKREKPRLLGKEINTGKFTCHPFIAPDDSYLIWESEREGGYGGTDLYVSFRQQDGSWGTVINMGNDINTSIEDGSANVTPDGKYLFFTRIEEKTREDGTKYWTEQKRYWVSTQVIENLRPKE